MLDRDQLETFAVVAETGSFERAAASLNVSRGAVSQRVKALEQSMAAVLLVRAQPVVPTAAGETLLRHVLALRLMETDLLREISTGARPSAPVAIAIAVNPDSLATWFPQAVWPILLERRITLEIVVDDEDHTDSRLSRGEVIGCVSTDAHTANAFAAEPLGAMSYRCYANPAFSKEFFANGLTVPAVGAAPAILFDRKDTLHDSYLTRCFGFPIAYPRHRVPAPTTLMDAVLSGIGYGLLPANQAAPLVAAKKLIELGPCEELLVKLYWHHWASEPRAAQEITRCVVAAARQHLVQTV